MKKVAGGHHGGAWKVAYADFVTAMMAFFLLLWLLNVVTSQALDTISDYFDPTAKKISDSKSGAGGLMGGTTVSPVGAMTSDVQPLTQPTPTGLSGQVTTASQSQTQAGENMAKKLAENLKKQENESFAKAKAEMEKEIAQNPALQALAKNLMVDITPEGLRIQLVDQQGRPMFPSGSAELFDYTKQLVALVAKTILSMPNDISVRGHTDSHAYPPGARYTNWELSADRANATRRELSGDGVPDQRLKGHHGPRRPRSAESAGPRRPAQPPHLHHPAARGCAARRRARRVRRGVQAGGRARAGRRAGSAGALSKNAGRRLFSLRLRLPYGFLAPQQSL